MADQQGAQTSTWRGGGRGWRGGRGGRRRSGGRGFRPPPPPDHFISLRVPPDLAAPFFDAAHAALRGYAGGVLEPYLVARETAHVTLAVVRLDESSTKGGVPLRGEEEERKKAAGSEAAPVASRGVAPWAQRQRDPLKVDAATRALEAAAESISAALLEEGGRSEAEAEAEGNEDEPAKTTTAATTSVASALLSGLRIEPELGTFGRGRVLWLKVGDGVGGRALAAAERAVARALEAEAAVLLGGSGSGGQSPSPQPPQPPRPPAKHFTPHITVAKVPWIPQAGSWRSAPRGAGPAASSSSSSRPPPSWIPREAHEGALAGLPRSPLFGAPELELCRIGSSSGGQYYEVVATAKISVAAAKEEGGGGG